AHRSGSNKTDILHAILLSMFLVLYSVTPVDKTVFHDEGTAPAFVSSKRSNPSNVQRNPNGSDGLNVLNGLNYLNRLHPAFNVLFAVKSLLPFKICLS
ncbi:MAG TPA: hypothetical protein VGB27_01830, partial [Candidatus Binatia bacterium]